MQTLREQGLDEKAIISDYTDKGWKLSTVTNVCSESTTPAQPFCVNQAVGDLPQHLRVQFVAVRQYSTVIRNITRT